MSAATSIARIDLEPYRLGGEEERAGIAEEIDATCRDIGFFIVRGHGLPKAMIRETMALADAFFRLPLEEKLKIKQPATDISRGYTALAVEQLSAGIGEVAPPDLKELIDIGPVDVKGGAYYTCAAAGNHFHPNLWPESPEGFREHMEAYYRAMNGLADLLMDIFALALNLPQGFFADKLDKNMSALRLICYPEQIKPPEQHQLRSGAHTDYGTLTILAADDAPGGLQARHRNGEWIDILPEPGEFVINIGDAMEIWTNQKWVSTLHRVSNPDRKTAPTARRLSMPFFHQPNYDALISPLSSCIADGEPTKFEETTFGEHWMQKWIGSRTSD
ncbi:MAG: 2-oxoglutarate and iron-dependent oxygenase domain-containing protein [Pseudomonadota bacterium]